MKVSVSYRQIIRLALPISASLLVPQINFFANTAFLGRYGETELAVNGVAGLFYLILSMVGYGLASGIQVIMARRAGEGKHEELSRSFANGIFLSLFISLCLMVLCLWMAPLLFGLYLHSGEHALMSIDFLYLRVWGLPFLMLTQLMNAFFIVQGKTRYLLVGSITAALVNILMDYALIFGNWGFPEMGLQGAALGSILAEVAAFGVVTGFFFYKKLHLKHHLRRHLELDLPLIKRMSTVATPLVVQYFFSIGGWQLFFIYIEHLGEGQLAVTQMLRSILGIIGIATWAFAVTCNMMVSNIIGQGLVRQVVPLIKKVCTVSFLITAGISLILWLAGPSLLAFYRDDPALIALGLPSLRIILIASLIMSLGTTVYNGVVGTGSTWVNLGIEVFCVCVYVTYCTIVIEHLRLSLTWAWMSEFVYWTTLLLTSGGYLLSYRWRGKKV